MKVAATALLALSGTLSAGCAEAATNPPCRINTLDESSLARFKQDMRRGCPVVRLESSGGTVMYWVEVADLIQASNAKVRVKRQCSSACTIAMLAAQRVSINRNARVVMHPATRSWDVPGERGWIKDPNPHKETTEQILRYYAEHRVPQYLIDAVRAGRSVKLTAGDFVAMGLNVKPQ